jgi:hypothetical protein
MFVLGDGNWETADATPSVSSPAEGAVEISRVRITEAGWRALAERRE